MRAQRPVRRPALLVLRWPRICQWLCTSCQRVWRVTRRRFSCPPTARSACDWRRLLRQHSSQQSPVVNDSSRRGVFSCALDDVGVDACRAARRGVQGVLQVDGADVTAAAHLRRDVCVALEAGINYGVLPCRRWNVDHTASVLSANVCCASGATTTTTMMMMMMMMAPNCFLNKRPNA
jgi:hypothetical protein